MADISPLLVLTVGATLVFEFTNGMHDTANAIATVVSTRILGAGTAIMMSAALNLAGALFCTEVAKTIAGGLVHAQAVTPAVVLSAVLAAITWNMITWSVGLPSSSTHALVGGLCGAALVHAGGTAVAWGGVFHKVLFPMVVSPAVGFVVAMGVMLAIVALLSHATRERPEAAFRKLQILSAAGMSFAHGQADAQKGMGIITLALLSAGFITTPTVPRWVMVLCALTMALGTASGGWRIIKTMGHKIVRLEPVHGFAAESAAALVILLGSHAGMTLSTTHVVTGCIFGVGATRRLSAPRWGVARSMVFAWVLTLPAAALVAALTYSLLGALGAR
jgi:PiT family inorganic phosphate transporter